ncbi:hypothetical protein V4890_18780 [Ralstonia solanacearum species complex bacterium KE056]|uniref:hypothetical protein n=1 Tax=Ralstonia solanacearum species complex bacterium KE056 TaxID=3119585 RepID=UPI002FC3DB14
MDDLIFEKVGDINFAYPYMCICREGESESFMEIGITNAKKIEMAIYPNERNVVIGIDQWEEISKRARVFLKRVLEDDAAS